MKMAPTIGQTPPKRLPVYLSPPPERLNYPHAIVRGPPLPAANVPQRGASPGDGLAVPVLRSARLAGVMKPFREAHWAFRGEECQRPSRRTPA